MKKCLILLFLFILVPAVECMASVASPAAIAVAVESIWGGMWHKTNPDGSQVDCIDAGLNSGNDFAGMTFTVTGPNGFSYTFDNTADRYADIFGSPEVYKEFSTPLPPGVYTFSLDDGNGHLSKVADTHVTAAALPLVDASTIQSQRQSNGYYRFTWAPVNDTRTYYYRLVIVLDDASQTAVYYGQRKMNTSDTVPAYYLQDGTAYKVRVEIHDAPSFGAVTNRSYSALRAFNPQPADYDSHRPSVDYAVVYNRYEADGALATDLSLGLSALNLVSSASVTGPGGFSYTFDLVADQDSVWPELYKKVSSALTPGRYTFQYVVNGVTYHAYATLTAPVSYPAVDASTCQAEDQGNGNVRFSWGDVDHLGALYYRVMVVEPATGNYLVTQRSNRTWVDVPTSDFSGYSNPQWRVEVMDSPSIATQRNRRVGMQQALAVQPYDASKPVVYASIGNATNFDASPVSDIWMSTYAPAGAVSQMRLAGPNGYLRDIFDPSGYTDFLEPVTPAPGLYRFTATDSTGKSTVRYNYQTAPHTIPPVDFRTVSINQEDGGWISINWAPVASDLPVWYGVDFYLQGDAGDGRMQGVSVPVEYYFPYPNLWLPSALLPGAPFMIRILAYDGSDGSTYNNYSRSVLVGYQGTGFDYGTLTDEDHDGFASNVDANDNDATVNLFPYPAITDFRLSSIGSDLTASVTAFTTVGRIAAWCLTETNSSASCSWKSSVPASYTFSSPGSKTLYAFVRGVSGNISAAASAQTSSSTSSASLTLTFTGSGEGSVTGGMSCSKGGSCAPASFPLGTTVTLTPQPGIDSIFTGWGGDCAVNGDTCSVTMSAAKAVSAGFGLMPSVWIGPGKHVSDFFGTLADAYGQATAGATIETKAATFTENLALGRNIRVTFRGGYGAGYASNAGGRSVVNGTLKVSAGTVVADRIAVH